MFKSEKRISLERFKEILGQGKKIHSTNMYLSCSDNDLDHPRFAVVVPKKVLKKAFMRHKVKRRANHALRDLEAQFKPKDYIIFVNKGVVDMSFDDIKDELIDLSDKLN